MNSQIRQGRRSRGGRCRRSRYRQEPAVFRVCRGLPPARAFGCMREGTRSWPSDAFPAGAGIVARLFRHSGQGSAPARSVTTQGYRSVRADCFGSGTTVAGAAGISGLADLSAQRRGQTRSKSAKDTTAGFGEDACAFASRRCGHRRAHRGFALDRCGERRIRRDAGRRHGRHDTMLVVNFRTGFAHPYATLALPPDRHAPLWHRPRRASFCGTISASDPSLSLLSHNVVERAQGNPFFLEELVNAMVERGDFEGEEAPTAQKRHRYHSAAVDGQAVSPPASTSSRKSPRKCSRSAVGGGAGDWSPCRS